uniref:BAH domain-containing protein n=1 Tax=Parastrongyloides trichosuri TaxID=131310 RepID=A0A0N4ZKG7_PARTI
MDYSGEDDLVYSLNQLQLAKRILACIGNFKDIKNLALSSSCELSKLPNALNNNDHIDFLDAIRSQRNILEQKEAKYKIKTFGHNYLESQDQEVALLLRSNVQISNAISFRLHYGRYELLYIHEPPNVLAVHYMDYIPSHKYNKGENIDVNEIEEYDCPCRTVGKHFTYSINHNVGVLSQRVTVYFNHPADYDFYQTNLPSQSMIHYYEFDSEYCKAVNNDDTLVEDNYAFMIRKGFGLLI